MGVSCRQYLSVEPRGGPCFTRNTLAGSFVVLESELEEVLGQEVFTHGVQEFEARGKTFVSTESALMVPVDGGEVEITSYEKTLARSW